MSANINNKFPAATKIAKKHRRNISLLFGSGVLAAGGVGVGITYAVMNKKPADEIIDQQFSLSDLKNWNYGKYTTKHKAKDFSNKSSDDQEIIKYFHKYYHSKDLLNTIVSYFNYFTEYTNVTVDGESVPLMSTLTNNTHMHVLYIRESSDDGFHLFLVYNFRFNKSFVFDEIPIDTHTVVELTIHNNSKFDAIINKAYYIPNSDFDMQQYQGNNLQLTISPKPNDGFMIETVIGETTSDIVLYDEVTKTNWSALPIVGFDDVKLPTEN